MNVSLGTVSRSDTKSGFPTPFILQSAQADFVCVDAVSTAEFDLIPVVSVEVSNQLDAARLLGPSVVRPVISP